MECHFAPYRNRPLEAATSSQAEEIVKLGEGLTAAKDRIEALAVARDEAPQELDALRPRPAPTLTPGL